MTCSCGQLTNIFASAHVPAPSGRAADDLANLLVQEAASMGAERDPRGAAERAAGGGIGSGGGGGGGAKSKAKKKRLKKKRATGGSSNAAGTSNSGCIPSSGGDVGSPTLQVSRESAPATGRRSPEGAVGVLDGDHDAAHHHTHRRGLDHATTADNYSSDSSGVGVKFKYRGDRKYCGQEIERSDDESFDDEEEQMGVVKKLRWRTEVGLRW